MKRIVLLLLFCFPFPRALRAQQASNNPPTILELCPNWTPGMSPQLCDDLRWAGDHYDALDSAMRKQDYVYLLGVWSNGNVTLAIPNYRGSTHVAYLTGKIAPSGDHVVDGKMSGVGFEGMLFTAKWQARFESQPLAAYLAAHPRSLSDEEGKAPATFIDVATRASHRVNGILVPPYASDEFATYPDDVRAILLPEHPLSLEDAMRPCASSDDEGKVDRGVNDPVVALEIGRFATRAGDQKRGMCWINHSAALDYNSRAVTLVGVFYLMGWRNPKDPVKAFNYFDTVGFQKHDVWALYYLEQAYLYGIGHEKNLARATGIDSFLMSHDEGQNMLMLIGSDDENVIKRAIALKKAMNPRMHMETQCHQVGPNTATAPGSPRGQSCVQILVPDKQQ